MKEERTIGLAVLAMLRQLRDPSLRLKGERDNVSEWKVEVGSG